MKFAEAMAALASGKKVRKLHWPVDSYIHIIDGDLYDEKGEPELNYQLDMALQSAHNWEVYLEPEQRGRSFSWALRQIKKGETVSRIANPLKTVYSMPGTKLLNTTVTGADMFANDWRLV